AGRRLPGRGPGPLPRPRRGGLAGRAGEEHRQARLEHAHRAVGRRGRAVDLPGGGVGALLMRKAWQATLFFLWCFACFLVFFPPSVAVPTRDWRLRMAIVFARWWSRGCLWIAGVRLHVVGREHARVPAIFTFNHASNLDFFVNACLVPHGTLVFG